MNKITLGRVEKPSTKRGKYETQKRIKEKMLVQFFSLVLLICVAAPAREFYLLGKELEFKIEPVYAQEKQLSVKDYAWEQAKKHGLDPVSFVVIIFHESRFNPEAININVQKSGRKSVDIGLLQINSIHQDISLQDKLDPYKAIDWAIEKRLKDGNYRAWVAANTLGIVK
jgi:hypothetical protein